MKNFFLTLLFGILAITKSNLASAVPIDVMYLIDDTDTMSTEIAALQGTSFLDAFTSGFSSSADVQLGLVSFNETATLVSDLTSDVGAIQGHLNGMSTSSSLLENGALAIETGATASFRSSSERHFIMLTDETGDMTSIEAINAGFTLSALGATFWVHYSGSSAFFPVDYVQIQVNSGSVDQFADPLISFLPPGGPAIPTQLTTTFADIESISIDQDPVPVPEPSTLGPLGAGLLGLGFVRRRRAA